MLKYTETRHKYFSDEDASYTLILTFEEDGTLDQWAQLQVHSDIVELSCARGNVIENIKHLRNLLDEVLADNEPNSN